MLWKQFQALWEVKQQDKLYKHTHKDFCTHLNVINTERRQDLGKNSKGLITERWMEVTSHCRYKTKDSPSTGMIATPRHYKRDICGH